jgi:hypothetical protein
MIYSKIIEQVAQAIYHNDGGMTDEEYEISCGKSRLLWWTSAPWDTDPNELCEHERDEYRIMAEAAIKAFLDSPEYELEIIRHIMET